MANIRYRSEFYSDNGVFWRVNILDMAHTYTTPTDFTCGSPFFSANYAGSKERFDPVVGSVCKVMALVEDSDFEAFITDIIGSAEQRFFCKIYKASSGSLAYDQANCTIWWMGVLLQDLGKFEDVYYPYEYEISFTDGLAALKDIDFVATNGTLYSGRATFITLLIELLSQTGLMTLFASGDVFLKTSVHWYDVHQHFYANADPLAYANVAQETFYKFDNDTFTPSKCLDVLQMILSTWGARIMLSEGCFHIVQVNELINSTLITRSYNKSGTLLSYNASDDYLSTVFNILAGGSTTFFPALKQVTKNYEYQQAAGGDNLLPDPYPNASVTLLGLVAGGANYNLFFTGTIQQIFYFTIMPPPFQMKYTLSLILDLGVGASPRYYSLFNGDNGQFAFQWVADDDHVCTFWSGMFTPALYIFQYLNINFMTLTVPITAGDSATGYFTFSQANAFYNQYYQVISISGATPVCYWLNFNLVELNSDLQPTSGNVLFRAINSAIATETLEIPDTLIGDANSGADIGKIMTSDGSSWVNSSSWRIKNGTQNNLITQLMVNEVLKGQQTPCARVTHSIISKVYGAQRAFVFTTGKHAILSATFSANNDTWEGEWFIMNLLLTTAQTGLDLEPGNHDSGAVWGLASWYLEDTTELKTDIPNKNKLSALDSSSLVTIINNFSTGVPAPNANALPDPGETKAGILFRVIGNTGEDDILYVCIKNAAGVYVWKEIQFVNL